jgi:hypothetical protein
MDMAELEKLCSMQCTRPEIAAWFVCHIDSIDARIADKKTLYQVEDSEAPGYKINLTFQEIMQRGYARGQISMRRQQIKMLNDGNGTMAVWLGKQYLGQRDIVHHANPDGTALANGSIVDQFISRLLTLVERRGEIPSGSGNQGVVNGSGSYAHVVELENVGPDETT